MLSGAPGFAYELRKSGLVAARVLWFSPRDIPRRVSSVDEFEAFVLGEVSQVPNF